MDISNGIFALAGTLIGLGVSLLRDIFNNRSKIRLEKLKLHDRERIEAYKKLFVFAKRLTDYTYPAAEHKREMFEVMMKNDFRKQVEPNYIYFNEEIMEILDTFNHNYVILRDGLEIDFPGMQKDFYEKELYELSKKLESLVKKKIKL